MKERLSYSDRSYFQVISNSLSKMQRGRSAFTQNKKIQRKKRVRYEGRKLTKVELKINELVKYEPSSILKHLLLKCQKLLALWSSFPELKKNSSNLSHRFLKDFS